MLEVIQNPFRLWLGFDGAHRTGDFDRRTTPGGSFEMSPNVLSSDHPRVDAADEPNSWRLDREAESLDH